MEKRIGIVVKQDPKAQDKAKALVQWLCEQGVTVIRNDGQQFQRQLSAVCPTMAPADLSCIIVLGGDGTFLSAVRWIGNQSIPILGVKFGEVGFLAETLEEDLFAAAQYVLTQPYTTEKRMRLMVTVERRQQQVVCETVLNDIVINKSTIARLGSIRTTIDDTYLTTFRADGLIIATPTGSTAYSLAAGGPVIHPAVPSIILTPICPFTLTNRPLIVPDTSLIRLCLEGEASPMMLTFDGQAGMEISSQDTIVVRKSAHPVHMITMPDRHYFDILKAKLSWSGGRV